MAEEPTNEPTNEYIKDKCFHDAIAKLKEYIEKYKDEEYLEIEFRLGYLEDDEFRTDIGQEFFNKINDKLVDSEVWSSISYEKSEDYFYNGKRLSITEKNPNGTCIKKEKLAIFDFIFCGTGFDLRVSFSREIPSNNFPIEKAIYKRVKERHSYNYKHLSYDLTQVTLEDNSVEDHVFEIELEIKQIDLSKMTSHYLIHDSLLKIKDMVEMCEEIDDNPSLELKKEKIIN
jgi:hypothetical protein